MTALSTPARTGTLESTAGTPLWFAEAGAGRPIVLCDGLGCDGFVWKYLAEEFARDHRVVHWHYRGHGNSAPPADPSGMTVRAIASDLVALLDELALRDAVLVGHSLGVQVILEAWLQLRERGPDVPVTGLVAVCGAAGRVLDTFKNTSLGLHVLPWVVRGTRELPEVVLPLWQKVLPSPLTAVYAWMTEVNPELASIDDIRPYLQRLSRMDPRNFFSLLQDASGHDLRGRLGEVSTPVLVVAAERDTFTPLRRSTELASGLGSAELFVLPAATHTAPLEWPDMLHLRIRRFLRDKAGEVG